ncbi:MAG: DNA repair protein RecO [Rhodospirillales bacterium]|nr:DNA repair protein RecO [Rhodospirillales bacterium]
MEWSAPVIVLETRPFGEGDALATVFSAAEGTYRGLARGGSGRRGAALWQRGNVLSVRWVARLAEQLGSFSAEMIHPTAALAMADGLQLAMLDAALAVAEGALPEREPHPQVFAGLFDVIRHLAEGPAVLADLVRWEIGLLAALGYGLDLSRCAATGSNEHLAFVSPRTGRAVSETAAGPWRERLLKLPTFLLGPADSDPAAWRDGLLLSGHFLARNVFGLRHRPLPQARLLLYDRVAAMSVATEQPCPTL